MRAQRGRRSELSDMKRATPEELHPLAPGERAPGFVLPAANREGMVALEDYRGKRALG